MTEDTKGNIYFWGFILLIPISVWLVFESNAASKKADQARVVYEQYLKTEAKSKAKVPPKKIVAVDVSGVDTSAPVSSIDLIRRPVQQPQTKLMP